MRDPVDEVMPLQLDMIPRIPEVNMREEHRVPAAPRGLPRDDNPHACSKPARPEALSALLSGFVPPISVLKYPSGFERARRALWLFGLRDRRAAIFLEGVPCLLAAGVVGEVDKLGGAGLFAGVCGGGAGGAGLWFLDCGGRFGGIGGLIL